jgi:hypothetical protein
LIFYKEFFVKKYFFGIVAMLTLISACASKPAATPGMDLDVAIRLAAAQMETKIPSKTMVALVSVASPSTAFSTQVLTRLESEIVSRGNLVVVDRANLDKVRAEQGFQLSGEVDDESAKSIGKLLGAGAIVTGTLADLGDVYSLTLKAINIETATVAVSYLADLAKTKRIETLLATRDGAGSGATASGTAQRPASTGQTVPAQAPRQSLPSPAGPFTVGDKGPGGGIIFYVNEAGFTVTADGTTCHYLEAAPADLSQMPWASSDARSTNVAGTAIAVGAGKKNTNLILAADPNSPAANACRDYSLGGKNDWFLPSMGELVQFYNNREIVGVSFGLGVYYFSSSQESRDNALGLNSRGNQDRFSKSDNCLVRPIRAF